MKESTSTIYIDESGDLGHNKGTRWFVISAAIITQHDEKSCLQTLRKIQNTLNVKKIHIREIREFNKRAYVVRKISHENFIFMSVIVDTNKLKLESPAITYNYACRLLLERCSWFLRDNNQIADIILSSRGTSRDSELIHYIKHDLLFSSNPEIKIEQGYSNDIKAISAGQRTLLSLPDICATTTFLSYEKDRFGFTYPCFMKKLADKIYSYNGHTINYGIKYFNSEMIPNINAIFNQIVDEST